MAVSNTPPNEVTAAVLRQMRERMVVRDDQLGARFSFKSLDALGSPATSSLELGETFELWRLTPSAVERYRKGGGDLAEVAKRAGGYHHQIRLDADTVGFARSSAAVGGDRAWAVQEIFVSGIAEDIDRAIDWADANIPDDKLARLLSAPAYRVEALWFVDMKDAVSGKERGGQVLIASGRSSLLTPLQLLDAPQFLDIIKNLPMSGKIK